MSDPADTPAADPSSVKYGTEPAPKGPPEPRFAPGDPVPHREMWILERRLGEGGFGEVWLARHEYRDDPPVAVKFCTHPSRHALATHEKRVIVRAMKHVGDHPNVVPLLDCNLSGDTPWLLYQYVHGGTLADAIEEYRARPPRGRLTLAARTLYPIAVALTAFHRFEPPIVHRDMKPQNVLMAGNVPRITDFGIGGIDHPLPTVIRGAGTLLYCSPERLRHPPSAPHPRDDVFALGVIAYQLLRADLQARPGSDAARHLRALDTPAALVELITDSVAEEPGFRPADAGAWEQALTAWLPAGAAPVGAPAAAATGAGQRVTFTLAGKWSARPVDSQAAWTPVADTPGPLPLAPNTEYSFHPRAAVTDHELAGLRALSGAPWFRGLDLSWCEQITDAGLFHLTALGQLRDLDLSGCSPITNLGLSYLTALKNLRHLDLSCCSQITDHGLGHLAGLSQLRYLTILICEGLTDAGVDAFRAAVPGREVRC